MATWSAENATRAYLRALKMGKRGKEPDVAEFISALAAGNNAQVMVEVCSGGAASASRSTTLALVAAAYQTGGCVFCVLPCSEDLAAARFALGPYSDRVELVGGEAVGVLLGECGGADFVLVDCHVDAHDWVLQAAGEGGRRGGGGGCVVVGYNALGHSRVGKWGELKGHYLPIGQGLLVGRVAGGGGGGRSLGGGRGGRGKGRGSRWVVKVDKCTGEEHVFRVTFPQHKVIKLA